ncbi:MAG: GNAT family N-acetyltransferase [Candidatus Geothermarchaeales archaeon]
MSMRLTVGCDLEEFKAYYKTSGWAENLGPTEEEIIREAKPHLIVFRERDKIVGHAIWHETDTEEHREGEPRDREDRETLEKLLGGRKAFVELHELWLKKEHRGKGYGERFFGFFEDFIAGKGHDSIIYYAFDPAAIALCRRRGYGEAQGAELAGEEWTRKPYYVFSQTVGGDT